MLRMNLVLGLTQETGVRLAEVGFLLMLIAGVWLAAALQLRRQRHLPMEQAAQTHWLLENGDAHEKLVLDAQ
jgi:hypothetical protein